MKDSQGCDPAELPQASHWPDIAGQIDGDEEQRDSRLQRTDAVRLAFSLIAEHPKVEVAFWAFCVARKFDFVTLGRSNGTLARLTGVTESDFSKVVNQFCDLFGGPRPPALKSQSARASYSRVQREDHWRDRNGLDFVARNRKA